MAVYMKMHRRQDVGPDEHRVVDRSATFVAEGPRRLDPVCENSVKIPTERDGVNQTAPGNVTDRTTSPTSTSRTSRSRRRWTRRVRDLMKWNILGDATYEVTIEICKDETARSYLQIDALENVPS